MHFGHTFLGDGIFWLNFTVCFKTIPTKVYRTDILEGDNLTQADRVSGETCHLIDKWFKLQRIKQPEICIGSGM